MVKMDQAIEHPPLFHLPPHFKRGIMDRFIAQTKAPPVHDKKVFGLQFKKGLCSLCGIDVRSGHKPSGFVGPQIEDREVDGIFLANLFKTIEVRRIP